MTVLNHRRLSNEIIKLDIEGLRRGDYSDKYFENVVQIFAGLEAVGYTFGGDSPRELPVSPRGLSISDLPVEVQIFNRREPRALVAGVDVALAMLRHVAGFRRDGQFVERWQHLEVEGTEDGVWTHYAGDPMNVQPVIKVRGAYRDFAILETPLLGVLTRASRVATNVYEVLEAANGKSVLFFPARFDLPAVQALDGYAYWLAVQCYNHATGRDAPPLASTDAQGAWWGGRGGGTVPHALIAAFLGDTAEAMLAFARYLPVEVPRIVLADFNNDSIAAARAALDAYWPHYRAALEANDEQERRRWSLFGVRLDTGGEVRDVALQPDGAPGVNPQLVRLVREALDNAWQRWDLPDNLIDDAKNYCKNVQIVVSGGFDRDRIAAFERASVPVDSYGVGSSLLMNTRETKTDYTMDVVRVRLDGRWVDMAKVGRRPCDNPDLQPVDLSAL